MTVNPETAALQKRCLHLLLHNLWLFLVRFLIERALYSTEDPSVILNNCVA
jgi:hypothetical protein